MISLRAFFLAPLWGFAAVMASIFGYNVGPDLEETLSPVITDQAVSEKRRMPDQACWSWKYSKQRSVTWLQDVYFLQRDDGVRYPVEVMRPDLGIPTNDSTTAKAGVTRTIPQCVMIPEPMRSAQHFVITGEKLYLPWHRIWHLTQEVEPVEFDPGT